MALAAAPASARRHGWNHGVYADPSNVAAAEIAFNRLAREQGQWTAFRSTAADDAVMFVPQKVLAIDWLKKRPDPPTSMQWQPQRIYISCDGRTAASTGAWQRSDGSTGYFTTIWRLNDKGTWKWVLEHSDVLATPLPKEDFLEGHVATCRNEQGSPLADAGSPDRLDQPRDESLLWNYHVQPDGSREVRVRIWDGAAYRLVIDDKVAVSK